ncbi:MAG: glycosyltransferase family 4 protein [Flavobacterium sp.]|jgi:glycosyltransferase involved in cell wall biosynthesis|uniref:glycosyltransferase family 4 protein n=1 Tax=Flavobacterium sp. TaxID=239 RepID=UPI0025C396B0|nr:glycosyltransferase family 4 protein [Flavobacterium sp.]MCA1965414.1 glycosyltransferase family 4 protein [Flavobacterium sp.]
MKNILFIHQSAELYGSDKTLLLLLKNLDKNKFKPIVLLPFDGPLKEALENENIEVVIAPVLKLYRKLFTPKNLIGFFKDIKAAFKIVNKLHKKYQFTLIYSNTLAVLLGIMFAWKNNIKHLWHVHEIIEKPSLFKKAFVGLLSLKSNTHIVYNSQATKVFWELNKNIINKGVVIWNGIEINTPESSTSELFDIRKNLFLAQPNEIILALVGRISRWKGQMILLDAFNNLVQKNENIKLVFVGAPPPNQEKFQEDLEERIASFKLNDKVLIIPFQNEIHKIWQAIDIAVVPSTEPEPFGMVAIEAMLAHKPIVGSNHGGLTEIIENNATGFLVTPNSVQDLVIALEKLIQNELLRKEMGEKGYLRVTTAFSVEQYVDSFEKFFEKI